MRKAKLTTKLKKVLERKKDYEESDDLLIAEVEYQLYLMNQAKKSIKKLGILCDVGKEKEYLQVNQAVSIYQTAVKNLMTILTKLNITPQERAKIGVLEKTAGFDVQAFING